MQIRLDYASSANATRPWVWWLLIAALLANGAAVWQYTRLQDQRNGLQLRLQAAAQLSEVPPAAPPSGENLDKSRERIKQANVVLKELGLPWPALFAHLERTASPEVALLAIRPEAARGRLRISGEAHHLADVLEYVRDLGSAGAMSDVVLEQHEVSGSDPQKPVRFVLSARWGVSEKPVSGRP
ncbi:MAG: hypothetical protein A3K04_10900 [Gallionellales bacterium RBG_16_56_9]|nr:MAG: hypothetical protein A3K04_10900 [Gallionellales bacterium RBG_16_56_9]